jgi:hypothetical protein
LISARLMNEDSVALPLISPTRPRCLRACGVVLSGVWIVALVFGGGLAAAQTQTPALAIAGSVTGELTQGSRVTFQLDATAPGGYQTLRQLQVTMLLHNIVFAQITYYQSLNSITIRGSQLVRLGTPAVLEASFFRVSGLDVKTVTGGNDLQLTVPAELREDIPVGATFRLTAIVVGGASASVNREANVKVDTGGGGFSWGTLAAAVLAALFAGSFVGGLFGSHRRSPPRPSVYGAIKTRIEQEKNAG